MESKPSRNEKICERLNLRRLLGELQQEMASGRQSSAHAIALDITAAGSVPTVEN
jgi:hypothetical protein